MCECSAPAAVLARAFREDVNAHWVCPDPQQRYPAYDVWMQCLLEHTVEHGQVLTDAGGAVVQLWHPAPAGVPPALSEDRQARITAAFGDAAQRFHQITAAMEAAHPRVEHHYLALIGTDPSHQGQGLGTAALAPALQRCDETNTPAYLEASTAHSRALYCRLGFHDSAEPLVLEKPHPVLYPMWRPPHPH